MKNRITRILFRFRDGDVTLHEVEHLFYGLSMLLHRLINERYEGRKIKFINIYFSSKNTYEVFPIPPMHHIHYYSGSNSDVIRYDGEIDYIEFNKRTEIEQQYHIWEKACEYLLASSLFIKNNKLFDATQYGYKKGLEMKLTTDYRLVETDSIVYGEEIKASVWIHFRKDKMFSILALEKEGNVIWQRQLDESGKGIGFFLEIYKKIEIHDNILILKGHREIEYLPLKIQIIPEMIRGCSCT